MSAQSGVSESRYQIGDRVWVNGFGDGKVVRVGSLPGTGREVDFYYTVERRRDCLCGCGHRHQTRETTRAKAIHMRVAS